MNEGIGFAAEERIIHWQAKDRRTRGRIGQKGDGQVRVEGKACAATAEFPHLEEAHVQPLRPGFLRGGRY